MKKRRFIALLGMLAAILGSRPVSVWAQEVTVLRLEWRDQARGRDVPVKIYLPPQAGPRPLLVVSHGLGGSREGLEYLGQAWAAAGFLCIHPQHLGSDEGVWKGAANPEAALRRAVANPRNAIDRARDVSFVLDEALQASRTPDSPLFRRIDAQKIGVAGHSFGAWTALAAAGRGGRLQDARIKACVALSAPARDLEREKADDADFQTPVFHFTGTQDNSPIGEMSAANRRVPFDAITKAQEYLVILDGADHMTFESKRRKGSNPNDARDHDLIVQATTAFWRAYLENDADAKKWLRDGGFEKVLGKSGTFEKK